MQLTQSQTAALEALLASADVPRLSLSGAAGTGKTTLIKELVDSLPADTVVCTPTNKAAQVLCNKGIDATTFYKKFYILEDTVDGKPRFISCKKYLAEGGKGLPDGKLSWVGTLIIDEASMLTSRAINEMSRMCGQLILVGDHHQLPPVGDRDYPAGVFGSLNHTAELTEIMRQAEGNLILTLADALRRDDPKVGKMLKHFEPEESFQDLVRRGAQMIAFTNKERQRINHVCRRVLGFTQPYPQRGDKMVVTNNYSEDLINGTVITVEDFEWDQTKDFASIICHRPSGGLGNFTMDMRSFINDQIASQRFILEEYLPVQHTGDETFMQATFAYCLTAHKAQGSEWDDVVVFDQRSLIRKVAENDPRGALSPDEFTRRWTYTAITRARKNLYWAPTWYAQVTERGI
jgi:exodeoxyribonuclease-5